MKINTENSDDGNVTKMKIVDKTVAALKKVRNLIFRAEQFFYKNEQKRNIVASRMMGLKMRGVVMCTSE